MRDRPALNVLPRKPHLVPLQHKASESERLGSGPVNALAAVECRCARLQDTLNAAVGLKPVGKSDECASDAIELAARNT